MGKGASDYELAQAKIAREEKHLWEILVPGSNSEDRIAFDHHKEWNK